MGRDLRILIEEARTATGLNLVAARDVLSPQHVSYHALEERTEGAAHRAARKDAIGFFISRGYQVFPEGVGIDGVFTLADFLAVRKEEKRIVFVEILSDAGVTTETIARKRALQAHGELCFVIFVGKRKFNKDAVEKLKTEIEHYADVLLYYLDGYTGNFIGNDSRATVAYQTTREKGIRVEASAIEKRNKTIVAVRYLTRLYQNPTGVVISDTVPKDEEFFEEQYLSAFETLCRKRDAAVKETRTDPHITNFRAMRRKSGLKALTRDGELFAILKSERRDSAPFMPAEECDGTVAASDGTATNLYGVYEFNGMASGLASALLEVYREMGCKVELLASGDLL